MPAENGTHAAITDSNHCQVVRCGVESPNGNQCDLDRGHLSHHAADLLPAGTRETWPVGEFDLRLGFPVESGEILVHILTDVHEILRRLSELEAEARPLLDAYKRTNGGTIGLLKARKAARGG